MRTNAREFTTFTLTIMHFVYLPPPPRQIFRNHFLRILFGRQQFPGEIGSNGYEKIGEGGGWGNQGALWSS